MWRVADDDAGIGILVVFAWGIAPYGCFWLATYLFERFTSIQQVPGIGYVIAILILIYSLLVYVPPLNHESSTEGLIFIFAPLWLYFACPILGLCVLVAWLSNRPLQKDSKK